MWRWRGGRDAMRCDAAQPADGRRGRPALRTPLSPIRRRHSATQQRQAAEPHHTLFSPLSALSSLPPPCSADRGLLSVCLFCAISPPSSARRPPLTATRVEAGGVKWPAVSDMSGRCGLLLRRSAALRSPPSAPSQRRLTSAPRNLAALHSPPPPCSPPAAVHFKHGRANFTASCSIATSCSQS